MKRIESLDYLRGIMALSVMIYHYISWSAGVVGSEHLIGKLGVYAVSMFYILSGLSLGLVYYGRVNTASDIGSFLIKRVFRIFPLFWLVLSVFLLMGFAAGLVSGKPFEPGAAKIFLNYSLLFGFVDPSGYFNTGAWSIGNEMVFYAILPVVFLLSTRSSLVLPTVLVSSLAAGIYFAVYRLDPTTSLAAQWSVYINPFNQLFLFMGGVALGVYGKRVQFKSILAIALLAASFLIFHFYPVSGDTIGIVTGSERFVFSFCCIAFVAGLYFWNPAFNAAPAKLLGFFGSACYSIYLLHPVIAKVVVPVAEKVGLGVVVGYVVSALVTLVASWMVFNWLEKPMMNMGKRVASRFEQRYRPALAT